MGDYWNRRDLSCMVLGMNYAYVGEGIRDKVSVAAAVKRHLREILAMSKVEQENDFETAYVYLDAALNIVSKERDEKTNQELDELKKKPV